MDSKNHKELATEITIAWMTAIGSLRPSNTSTSAHEALEFLKKTENVTDFYEKMLNKIDGR